MNTETGIGDRRNREIEEEIDYLMGVLDHATLTKGVELRWELRPFIEDVLREALSK